MTDVDQLSVAVVGMAGRFPGAPDLDRFWANLAAGTESITFFPPVDDEPATPVPACGVLADADAYDAEFFGQSPQQALITDPQQRLFLECAWEAVEDAGYDPGRVDGSIGVYAGSSPTEYLARLRAARDSLPYVDDYELRLGTGPDFLTTRVSYKLGLTGPAVTVQTACSTSLVAIHLACQALLAGECDMALAGGASVHVPAEPGHYTEGGILSADGRCRAFDEQANGTVGGDGVGVVVLKPLAAALADRDRIRAVVRGSAITNDGLDKIGYTAPSVSGQVRAIRAAHLMAGVDADSISYVEAHGTGTPLGDPIEFAALTEAFRTGAGRGRRCYLGSVKTNIGHTDAAAGVAGFIKTVLALEHRRIPASLHFRRPNPQLRMEEGPFVVPTAFTTWPDHGAPRTAAVNSLGIGGTNAHVILQEAPVAARVQPIGRTRMLTLSARTEEALASAATRLRDHLQDRPGIDLADVAWTLQQGRRSFPLRRVVVCRDRDEAIAGLDDAAGPHEPVGDRPPPVVFMFPGQGGQHIGMAAALHAEEPVFRGAIDRCAELAEPLLGRDLRAVLYPEPGRADAATAALGGIATGQPAVFAVEYALAELWRHWGVTPAAVLGHSLGAYAAACVAGVLSVEDAVRLVVRRGRLLQGLPAGAMLAVPLAADDVEPWTTTTVGLAAINGPAQTVLSGPEADIDALAARLIAAGVDARRLRIATAGHSRLVEPILGEFEQALAGAVLRRPELPLISDLTGGWVSGDVTDPAYWITHLRQPVRFGDALTTLAGHTGILVEAGPGRTLTSLARQHPRLGPDRLTLPSLPHPAERVSAATVMKQAAGRLWTAGVPLRWAGMYDGERPERTGLPTYPFQRRRYLVGPGFDGGPTASVRMDLSAPGAGDRTAAADEPGTDLERRLSELFAQILGLPRVGLGESFFDLGGDSLIAIQVTRWVRENLGVTIPVRAIFRSPTAAGLAALLDQHTGGHLPRSVNATT